MSQYWLEIYSIYSRGGPPEWRILDDTRLPLFLSRNINCLHRGGYGYRVVSIGRYLGPDRLLPLTLRDLGRRHCDDAYDCQAYELTYHDPDGPGDDPPLTEMTFGVHNPRRGTPADLQQREAFSRARQDQSEESARAGSWLLAEYDSIDVDDLTDSALYLNDQPIFTLKSVLDAGGPMRITAADYHDPGRYCL